MAYLLHVHITDAGGVGLIPDSLVDSSWATGFNTAVDTTITLGSLTASSVLHFFEDETALDAFLAATKVPAEHTATVDAWKTANSISVAYTLYDLSGSALDISGKSKY